MYIVYVYTIPTYFVLTISISLNVYINLNMYACFLTHISISIHIM